MINFINTYQELPENFYQRIKPSSAIEPKLIKLNLDLLNFLGIDIKGYSQDRIANIFSGKEIVMTSSPVAMKYAGHQFGHFNPQLGDGRAILLGEVKAKDKKIYDLHLKGSGKTAFSRGGDGRSPLGPVIREYIVSESMFRLGISTSRALSITTTGEKVIRDNSSPGASMVRVARGHIRIGTFEHFLYENRIEDLKLLISYSVNRFAPHLKGHDDLNFEFFKFVSTNLLKLVAKWYGIGFIHGVMNTDNTSVSSETIDYGPCAFMEEYSSNKVFSSIDINGRYSYSNQAPIMMWNLSSLANCMIAVEDNPRDHIEKYDELFKELELTYINEYRKIMGRKLGVFNPTKSDDELIKKFLNHLESHSLDFTNSFRELPSKIEQFPELFKRLSIQEESLESAKELMDKSNPYIIPRNHLVERAIKSALNNDFSFFEELTEALKNPFEENDLNKKFYAPANNEEKITHTFCGT